ncbi:VOC family protein [Thalassolituus sp. LLYu03]|uniref:VOC family protein n=1 Tax=Thalassolituus sp. LLYu03 TaxID=3421656 RepID=UPI003D27BA07
MTELTTAQPARHPAPTAKACRLAYLMFNRPQPEIAERFLHDFGLQTAVRTEETVFLRASDSAPFCYVIHQLAKAGFAGFGFEVPDIASLQALATLPGASAISDAPYPGGGQYVRLTDPSGFTVEAICGQQKVMPLPRREALSFNFNEERTRINDTQRPPVKAPDVLRLGHVVLEVADFQATSAWYTQHFGLIPSDVQVLPDGEPAVVFFRLDLGDTPADHHTLAMAQGFMPLYSHSAYELVDADAVGMGQRILREKKWQHAWGIGRHILGSQIFDYWQDPWGAKHEHYCDGDLFTADQPMGVHPVSRQAMSQWGQVMPVSFTKPKINLQAIRGLLHSLRHSPDVSVQKLKILARIFG